MKGNLEWETKIKLIVQSTLKVSHTHQVVCQKSASDLTILVLYRIQILCYHHQDLGCSEMHRLIPCPICEDRISYRKRSDSGRRRSDPTKIVSSHLFVVQELGTKICKTLDETVKCPNHEERVLLSSVIPGNGNPVLGPIMLLKEDKVWNCLKDIYLNKCVNPQILILFANSFFFFS